MIFGFMSATRPAGRRDCRFAGSNAVDRAVAHLNIEHFRRLLDVEKDEAKRQILLRLLAEEEAKLAALDNPPEPPANEDEENGEGKENNDN